MKRILACMLILVVALTIPLAGCSQKSSSGPSGTDKPVGLPIDYFPMKVGTEWTYQITLGEAEPMNYQEIAWPQANGEALYYSQTGFFYQAMADNHPDVFLLTIKVDSIAKEQGPLSYPNGVKLAILQDDLGIFEDASQVYWAASDSQSKVMIQQVCMYPSDTPGAPYGAWGSWGMEDGYSLKLILFGEVPGVGMSLADSPDTLYFVGIDKNVPGYNDTTCLHFKREVKLNGKGNGLDSTLDKDFTEDIWFAKGIGLVLLKQQVMGQNSMTWKLQ